MNLHQQQHNHDHHNHALPLPSIDPTTAVQAPITTTKSSLDGLVDSLPSTGHLVTHHHHQEHGMKMFFHGGFHEVILFDFWRTESFFGLFFSLFLVFLLGVLYEGVKWFRVYFQLWTSVDSTKSSGCVSMNSVNRGKGLQKHGMEDALIEKAVIASQASPSTGNCCSNDHSVANTLSQQDVYAPTVVRSAPAGSGMTINRWTWLMMYASHEFSPSNCRLIETGIYIFQLLLAYWLMLIAMTFNTYLTAAVVFGAGFGQWLFANIKCAPPRRCFCPACCDGRGGPEHADDFASDACH